MPRTKKEQPDTVKETKTKSMAKTESTVVKKTNGMAPKSPKKPIKKILFLVVLLLLVLGIYRYRASVVVATVNGQPIFRPQLWTALEEQGGAQTLDSLVMQELIKQEAKKNSVVVTQQDLDAELQTINTNLASQGVTLEQALASQGMTRAQLIEQLTFQKTLEKLVASDTTVTDEEVTNALSSYLAEGEEETPELREQVKAQLEQTKSTQAIQTFLADLRTSASINILNQKFALQ